MKSRIKAVGCGCLVMLITLAAAVPASAQQITDITPHWYGWVGQPNYVYIQGSGFLGPSVVDVRFNDAFATSLYVQSDTTIQVVIPANATTGYVSVRKSGGPWRYSPREFVIVGTAPYVDSFTPTTGDANTKVTLYGANLGGALTIKFGTIPVSVSSPNSDHVEVNAPSGVVTGPITVSSSQGTFVTSSNFFVPPVISSFSPAAGSPGTNVIITGTNFLGATSVEFGGETALTYTIDDNYHITATVPSGARTGRLLIRTPGGLDQTSSNFVIKPAIYSVSPLKGKEGTVVTITGANLTDISSAAPTVQFNGVAGTVVAHSYDQILVTAPQSSSGPITVTTADGSTSSPDVFYYPPIVDSFTPNNAPPGSTVTLQGRSLNDATLVEFNGLSASFSNLNGTTITATVPEGITTGFLTVTTPGGTTNSDALYYAKPVISSFNPTSGAAGTNVTIQGANFQGASLVQFNGKAAVFTNLSATELKATAPNGVTTGPISVSAPAGTALSAQIFVVPTQADLNFDGYFLTPNPVGVGESLTNTIYPANDGPNTASNVTVFVTLGPGMAVKSATTSRGTINTNGNPVVFSLGNMSDQDFPTLVLVVQPNLVGTFTNAATISSSSVDPDPGDNSEQRVTTVLPRPVLSITSTQVNRVRISWPVQLTNYALQFTPTLGSGVSWNAVSTPVVIEGKERVVMEDTPVEKRYYRLKK